MYQFSTSLTFPKIYIFLILVDLLSAIMETKMFDCADGTNMTMEIPMATACDCSACVG